MACCSKSCNTMSPRDRLIEALGKLTVIMLCLLMSLWLWAGIDARHEQQTRQEGRR